MQFEQLNGFAFDSESKVIGAVAGVDFIKQTITILTDEDDLVVAKLGNVKFLEKIGFIGKQGVVNHDILQTRDEKLYEVVLVGNDKIQMHLLDKKLNRVEAGDAISKNDLPALEPFVKVVGNIYTYEVEDEINFNIVVVREMTNSGKFVGYHYACNNKGNEEIDLIKVVFVGHHLLKEEEYERITIAYDEYLEYIADGSLVQVNPQELMNYVTGITYGLKEDTAVAKEEPEDECTCCGDCFCDGECQNDVDENEEDICYDCGLSVEDCECDEENEEW